MSEGIQLYYQYTEITRSTTDCNDIKLATWFVREQDVPAVQQTCLRARAESEPDKNAISVMKDWVDKYVPSHEGHEVAPIRGPKSEVVIRLPIIIIISCKIVQ